MSNGVTGIAKVARSSGICDFYDGTLRPGDPVVLRSGDGALLGKTELKLYKVYANPGADTPYRDLCTYDFELKGVRAGEPAYEITVGDFDPVVVSEAQLRAQGPYSVRGPINVAAGRTAQIEPPKA